MKLEVNGEARDVPEGSTVADLLRQLNVAPDRVAVEVSLEILDREEFPRRTLCEGDRIEILGFMGGGTETLTHFAIVPFSH